MGGNQIPSLHGNNDRAFVVTWTEFHKLIVGGVEVPEYVLNGSAWLSSMQYKDHSEFFATEDLADAKHEELLKKENTYQVATGKVIKDSEN